MIPAGMGLDSLVQYVSVELELDSKNEAHIEDRHGHENCERGDDPNYRAIQEDPTVGVDRSQGPGYEDGKKSACGEYLTREDREDAHFFAFVAHKTKWMVITTPNVGKHLPVNEKSRAELEIPC